MKIHSHLETVNISTDIIPRTIIRRARISVYFVQHSRERRINISMEYYFDGTTMHYDKNS